MNIDVVKRVLLGTAFFFIVVVGLAFGYLKISSDQFDAAYHVNQKDLATYTQPSYGYVAPSPSVSVSLSPTSSPQASPSPKKLTNLPPKVYLDVPFLVQAPNGNWDELHGEACEEASMIMVKHYIDKSPIVSDVAGDEEIIKFINYQTEKGYGYDITSVELADIVKDYYQLTTGRIESDFTVADIKRELAEGRPVIIPAAGRELGNPYFRQPGPPYHMLVIKGYDEQGFIANDPGTRRGKDFRYEYDKLYDAIHDWTGDKETISTGKKRYLVFD